MWRLEVLGMVIASIYAVLIYFYYLYIVNYQKDWLVFIPMIFLAVVFIVLIAVLIELLMYNNYIYDDTFKMMIKKSALIARKKILFTFLNLLIFIAFFVGLFFFPYIIPFISFAFYVYIVEAINKRGLTRLLNEEIARSLKPENLFLPIIREANNMKKVIVIGSSNMDYTIYVDKMPLDGETINGKSRYIQPGGKGSNQAVALKKAGADVCLFTSLGADQDGKSIIDVYNSLELKHKIKESKQETGNATIIVDKNSENRIIVIPGANKDILPSDISSDLIDGYDIIVLQNEILEETNNFILKNYGNRTIVYNPSPCRSIDEKLFKYISYFIINERELDFYGKGSSVNEKAQYLLSKGIKNILVTIGSKGSLLFKENGQIIEASAYKVSSVDTVAAGDTYLGYFVYGLSINLSDKEAMKLASKASAIAVTKLGAIASIPYLEEVNKYQFKD